MYYSLLIFNPFPHTGLYITGIFTEIFEKRQVAACCSLKEFWANARNISAITKEERSCPMPLQKSFAISKGLVLVV
jgi:hypothetical protein